MKGMTNASNIGGTVGDDTHPVKSVNGVLTPVTKPFLVNELTTGTGTPFNGCSLENAANPVMWYKVGRICTVTYAIRLSSAFTGQYIQYPTVSNLPPAINTIYPYNSQGLSVDGQNDTGGALMFVNTYGHLTILVRNQVMANKVVVGSVTYITEQ